MDRDFAAIWNFSLFAVKLPQIHSNILSSVKWWFFQVIRFHFHGFYLLARSLFVACKMQMIWWEKWNDSIVWLVDRFIDSFVQQTELTAITVTITTTNYKVLPTRSERKFDSTLYKWQNIVSCSLTWFTLTYGNFQQINVIVVVVVVVVFFRFSFFSNPVFAYSIHTLAMYGTSKII